MGATTSRPPRSERTASERKDPDFEVATCHFIPGAVQDPFEIMEGMGYEAMPDTVRKNPITGAPLSVKMRKSREVIAQEMAQNYRLANAADAPRLQHETIKTEEKHSVDSASFTEAQEHMGADGSLGADAYIKD